MHGSPVDAAPPDDIVDDASPGAPRSFKAERGTDILYTPAWRVAHRVVGPQPSQPRNRRAHRHSARRPRRDLRRRNCWRMRITHPAAALGMIPWLARGAGFRPTSARCTSPTACSPLAVTFRPPGCSPTGAASSPGSARASPSCGGRPIPAWCSYPTSSHVSHSLRKTLRQCRFEVKADTAFADVLLRLRCPWWRGRAGHLDHTGMRPRPRMHELGWHTQCRMLARRWLAGRRALRHGDRSRAFSGESMFARETDALQGGARPPRRWLCSPSAATAWHDRLPDDHRPPVSLGAREVPRARFTAALRAVGTTARRRSAGRRRNAGFRLGT